MIKNTAMGPLLYLLLAPALLLQNGSCHESKMNKNAGNVNQTQANSPQKSQTKVSGLWGGQGISMEVSDSGATLEFDCASGAITEAIAPDSSGKFTAKGLFARQHPGPTREDDDNDGQPATYEGVITGESLTLTITLVQSKEKVGTFTLAHGKMGRIRRCG